MRDLLALVANGGELRMRRWLGCLTLALIVAASPAAAFAGGVFFGFGGAAGDVDFDSTPAGNRFSSDDSLVGEWQVGYRFDSKLVIEGGGSLGLSIDTFLFGDFFSLSDNHVLVGYAFQPAERFSIIPELGVSRWHLDTEDGIGPFFGGQGVETSDSGSDLIGRVSFEWHVTERFRLYGAYTEAHYDFGDSTAPSFGWKFQF
jgi:Outer membrane protein beta-barrel domain